MIALFEIKNKEKKSSFLKKNFLLANLYINNVLGMLLLILSNVKVNFLELKLF